MPGPLARIFYDIRLDCSVLHPVVDLTPPKVYNPSRQSVPLHGGSHSEKVLGLLLVVVVFLFCFCVWVGGGVCMEGFVVCGFRWFVVLVFWLGFFFFYLLFL